MVRSSARLKSKVIAHSMDSGRKSKPLGKICDGSEKSAEICSVRARKKLDVKAKENDSTVFFNESVTTRSGKKTRLSKTKTQSDGKHHLKASTDMSDKRHAEVILKDRNVSAQTDEHEKGHPTVQNDQPHQSRKNSESNQSSKKKTCIEKKKDDLSTKHLKGSNEGSNDQHKKAIVLQDWVIKPVPNCRGICVEGQIEGQEDFWHSTPIADVLKPKLVVTASGSVYKLKGKINKLLAFDYGISKDLAKAFTNGFPPTWKELIKDYYHIMEQSITLTQECMSPEKFQALKTKRKSLNRTVLEPVDIHTILTPTGLLKKEMNHTELTTTRSGRMSLPPLAAWAGQHYIKVPGENCVQVTYMTDTAKQALGKETQQALALSKRDQKLLCQSAVSKNLLASSNNVTARQASSNSQSTSPAEQISNKSHKRTPKHWLSNEEFSLGKENALDILFQPEVSLTDCLSSVQHTSLKTKHSEDNLSEKKKSILTSAKAETVRNTSLDKQEVESAQFHQASSMNNKQGRQNKRDMPGSENPSNTAKLKKSTQNGFTHISHKLVCTNDKGCTENLSANVLNMQTVSLPSAVVNTEQSAVAQSSACSKSQQSAKNNGRKPMKASRKRKLEDPEQTGQRNDQNEEVEKSMRPEGRAKKQKLELTQAVDGETWTDLEKDQFYKALREVDGVSRDFWSQVSQRVGSRSVTECQNFHRESLQNKTSGKKKLTAKKPEKSKQRRGREKGGPIRGGRNTLKRKQDIRDFLDEQNEGYEDDPFKGTPFAKLKQFSFLPDVNIDFNKDESEIFGTNHNFFTPVAGKNPFDTPGLKFSAQLASVRKTPATQTVAVFKATPQTVETRKHDICIKHFMDQKKKALPSKVSPPKEDLDSSILPIKSLFPGTPKIFMDNIEGEDVDNDEDDGDDGNQFMYYFSDDD